LGAGRRRLDKGAWALLHAHRWPENARELERFLAELVVAVSSPRIGADDIPPHLRLRLLPAAPSADELESFEEAARSRLAPAVAAWVPVKDAPSLHNHVIDAAERALVQLALARTEGNRKAAAQLLGLARNTLHERIVRLGLDGG
jgi:two-component system nitrogen regulation response regulator GlnG